MFVECDEIETLFGEIFVQQEEHIGAAIEGASSEGQVEQRDMVDGKKQGEEEELEEGLLVLISNPRHDGIVDILRFIITIVDVFQIA